tara:strand:+ start:106 stop:426 length:321 start_codon:yes stop_codon:yes gene_type:complete
VDKFDLIVDKIATLDKNVDKKLDQIQLDIDDVRSNQIEMSHDVRRNADDLEMHMKRTELNEKRITAMEERLTIEHLLKLIVVVAGGIGSIVGSVYGVIKLIDYLGK